MTRCTQQPACWLSTTVTGCGRASQLLTCMPAAQPAFNLQPGCRPRFVHAAHSTPRNQSFSACHNTVPNLHFFPPPPPPTATSPSPSLFAFSSLMLQVHALCSGLLCFLTAGIQKHILADLATCFVTWGSPCMTNQQSPCLARLTSTPLSCMTNSHPPALQARLHQKQARAAKS